MVDVEIVVRGEAELGEGPVWDDRQGMLYWVDIVSGRLHRFDPKSQETASVDTGKMLGAAVMREERWMVGAFQDGFHRFNPVTGDRDLLADPEADKPENRFNDGKCDPQGRFWAGTMTIDGPRPEPRGSLYCLHPDGRVERKLDGVTISNGLGWSPDGAWMYYVDSPCREVWRFAFDGETTAITDRETVVRFSGDDGVPDGLTVDAEGMIWVAQFGGWSVCRWNPNTGEKLEEIRLPVQNVTSCTFGGEDLTDLYITSARAGLSKLEFNAQPEAGSVFRVLKAGKGLPAHRFGG